MWQRIKSIFTCGKREEIEEDPKHPFPPKLDKKGSCCDSEVLSAVGTSIIEGVKVAMATLLSIFVPQFCEDTGTTCTLEQNFTNLTEFNKFVVGWNFATLGLFCVLSFIQNKREAYFISHLDECLDAPYNSFTENCTSHPRIVRRVKEYNDKLYFWSVTVCTAFVINIIVSSMLMNDYYDGFRTVTTLLANVLLVSNRLYLYLDVCKQCRQAKTLALSLIKMVPASFNVVDEKYLPPDGKQAKDVDYLLATAVKNPASRVLHPGIMNKKSFRPRSMSEVVSITEPAEIELQVVTKK